MKRREALETIIAGVFSLTATQREVLAQRDWEPRVLSAEQARTVDVLSELIIPRTDTPGARDANVYRYIDLMLEQGCSQISATRPGRLGGA